MDRQQQEAEQALIYESDVIMDLDLCWQPHQGQALVKQALFAHNKKLVFLECGRKFGKTETLAYLLFRYCMMNPESACYFIAPFQKQAKELVWANGRLQNFFKPIVDPKTGLTHAGNTRAEAHKILNELNAKYGIKINESEMRIRFANGSFIKLDGADNHQAYRGISPHLIVYDEFKDHHPKFHVGMDPNLAAFDAPLIIVGTPPEGDENNQETFCSLADFAKVDPNSAYINAPTSINPFISKDFLKRKKAELYARGEDDKWLREYEAKRVRAGARSIFPMFESGDDVIPHTKHVRPESELLSIVKGRRKDYDWFMAFDPASASTFAVVLAAIHKKNKKFYVLDEIYESKKANMSTGKIFPRALALCDKWGMMYDDVRMIYDNAATWFQNEVADRYGMGLEPCMKDIKNKEARLSLIKDMMLEEFFIISDNCPKTIHELQDYRVNENGIIPKENDHAIDDIRYILSGAYYNSLPRIDIDSDNDDDRRYYTVESDAKSRNSQDPFEHIMQEYYHDD